FPEAQSLGISGVIGLERNDVPRPACRHRNPVRLLEKEWLCEDTATDVEVDPIGRIGLTVASNTRTHLLRRSRAISLGETSPGKRAWQHCGVSEYPTADDGVAGRMQLKQKQFAGLERAKCCR